ncbi:juvenile hormone esterase-like [Anticarsia gemmatalis]|uniref:juvenile hormone esterase-like n=1 Tax=Anticarsia gemmatalis TaxID=129554 RepID=UPI003F777A06
MAKVKVQPGWLAGEKLDTVTKDSQYYSFKGIPYAEPPLGKLRFKAPQPPRPWEGVRSATEHGPKCPQMDILTNQIDLGNEDCLYLNVYTPEIKPPSPLAVMVFIHGGGYKSGSGNSDSYGPDFLVSQGVILVTLNYRLEVLGFLCLDTEEVPGNAGLKDQVAALRWVKANIANFGGDPNNITVFGESAGGVTAMLHVLSPLSRGLFNRAISMSGVPSCDWCTPFMQTQRSFILGKQLGLETDDPHVLLDFLQNQPVQSLLGTNPTVMSFEEIGDHLLKLYHFTPVTEKDFGQEHFLTVSPQEALKSGKINDVDVFIGHTNEEMLFGISLYEEFFIRDCNRHSELLVPRKLQMTCTPEQVLEIAKRIRNYYFNGKPLSVDSMREFVTYFNHSSFVFDIQRFISNLSKVGKSRRYLYSFSMESERNVFAKGGLKYGIRGASHIDDMMYLFSNSNLPLEKNTREHDLVKLACVVFTNFAKYGNPTPDSSLGVTWPLYEDITRPYVDIGDNLTYRNNPYPEAIKFWRSIYAYVGQEY